MDSGKVTAKIDIDYGSSKDYGGCLLCARTNRPTEPQRLCSKFTPDVDKDQRGIVCTCGHFVNEHAWLHSPGRHVVLEQR